MAGWLLPRLAPGQPADPFDHALRRQSLGGGLLALVAGALDLLVQTAEMEGRTVWSGPSLSLLAEILTSTTVGGLAVLRLAAVAVSLAAVATGHRRIALGSALGALVATALVSHAAALPDGRSLALLLQILHLGAVAAWIGPLLHLLLAHACWRPAEAADGLGRLAGFLAPFSRWALVMATVAFLSGGAAALRLGGSLSALLTSAWGITLLVKLGLLLPLLLAAWRNASQRSPALRAAAAAENTQSVSRTLVKRFHRTLELEVTAALLVVAVAGVVGGVSPPGEEGDSRLTAAQAASFLVPRAPRLEWVDPQQFVGTAERNHFDRQYAEFMHNVAGLVVLAMGSLWFLQSVGLARARRLRFVWIALLVPFAVFISLFADPEVFLLPEVSGGAWWSRAGILEHQIGAGLVLILAVLAARDHHRPPERQPLGLPLAVVLLLGSFLLLGHAHVSARSDDELTNLIQFQHACLGGIGLFAGTLRWLQLRGLVRGWLPRLGWPLLVVLMGTLLAFGYRELP